MTTYSPIANGSVDAGSPVDESLVTALRDNPIAISEGSTGAPKLQTAAYEDGSVTNAKLSQVELTSAAGDVCLASGVGMAIFDTGDTTEIVFKINVTGIYRIRAKIMRFESGTGTTLVVKIKNGTTQLATAATSSVAGSSATALYNGTLTAGDTINITGTQTGSGSDFGVISASIGVSSDDAIVGRVSQGMVV
jgi:hypothetical protein